MIAATSASSASAARSTAACAAAVPVSAVETAATNSASSCADHAGASISGDRQDNQGLMVEAARPRDPLISRDAAIRWHATPKATSALIHATGLPSRCQPGDQAPASCRIALADSSDLGTNPATGASWIRSAKSASACVEIKMMTGRPELAAASRRARSMPLSCPSMMSTRTTSGRSSLVSRSASALADATPATVRPCRVRRSAAASRKYALSSIIRHRSGTSVGSHTRAAGRIAVSGNCDLSATAAPGPRGHVVTFGSATVGHDAGELGAGGHAGLPVHLAQVVVDGGGAQEQLPGDVPVALALADQPGDLRLLRRELGFGLGGPLAGAFAGGQQLDPGPFGERPGAHRGEHLVRGAELLAGVAAAALAAQPLAVHQVGAGQLGYRPALPQVPDGLGVQGLGVGVAGQQRPGPGEQPERQRGAGRGRPLREPPERGTGYPGLPAARGGLDQVGQHVRAGERVIVGENAEHTLERRLVVAQAELEHSQAKLDPVVLSAAAGAGRLTGDRGRDPARVRLPTAPGELERLRDACRPEDARIPGGR